MHFTCMPLYYFHLRTGEAATLPKQGRNFPDLSAALAEAQHAARALVHNRMRRARGEANGSLDIVDEKREPIARIMLAEVARQIS